MFASPLNHHKPGPSSVPYTLRRYLTMRELATAMFIAFAVLASIGGKEPQTKQPWFDKGTIGDLTISHHDKGVVGSAHHPSPPQKPHLLSSCLSMTQTHT